MSGLLYGQTIGGAMVPVQVTEAGALVLSGAVSSGPSGGTSDTTEATQLLVRAAVQSIDAKTPAPGAAQPISAAALPLPSGAATAAKQDAAAASLSSIDGKTPALITGRVPVDGSAVIQPISATALPLPTGASTAANQATANAAFGAPADARATWYDTAASIIQILKLAVAAFVGAGSRTYTYTSGQLTSEQWTLFGVTRTKTYTYTGGVLTGESDWV